MLALYRDEGDRAERRRTLRRMFEFAEDDGAVVVLLANNKYLTLLQNWLCHAEAAGLETRRRVLVLAFDEKVQSWARRARLHTLHVSEYGADVDDLRVGSHDK